MCHERSTLWAKTHQDMELRDSSQDKTWMCRDWAKTETCKYMYVSRDETRVSRLHHCPWLFGQNRTRGSTRQTQRAWTWAKRNVVTYYLARLRAYLLITALRQWPRPNLEHIRDLPGLENRWHRPINRFVTGDVCVFILISKILITEKFSVSQLWWVHSIMNSKTTCTRANLNSVFNLIVCLKEQTYSKVKPISDC